METCILRDPNCVQPQKAQFIQTPEPTQPGVSTGRSPALYVGLDVHTDSIAVSLAPSDSIEVRRYGLIGGTPDDVLRLAKKLAAAHPGLRLEFWYEAGPHGYPLCRFLCRHGYACHIASPSKIPRKPGERVKTNRRDADAIARLARAGELSAIHVPEPEDEAVRERCAGPRRRKRTPRPRLGSRSVRRWRTGKVSPPAGTGGPRRPTGRTGRKRKPQRRGRSHATGWFNSPRGKT
jgi:transposase